MQRLYDVKSNVNMTLHRRLVPAVLLHFFLFAKLSVSSETLLIY